MARYRNRKKARTEGEFKDTVSEEELLNRVVLAKALIAFCSGKPVQFKTLKEDIEITPLVAKDVMREAGFVVKKTGPASP